MITDAARVNRSAALSFSFHGALLGAYLFLKMTQTQVDLVLTQVDFIDLQPTPVAQEMPVREPKGVMDFLRMALPTLKPSGPQEAQPQEMPMEKEMKLKELPQAPERLKERNQPLTRDPALQLKTADVPRAESRFEDLQAKVSAPRQDADLAVVKEEPGIELEAVGRVAVREAAAPALRIDPNAQVSRTARMAEMTMPQTRKAQASPADLAPAAALNLADVPSLRRPARPSGSPPPLGYRGRSEISLGEKALARPARTLPVQEPGAAQPAAEPALQAARSKKAVELSGPLARRKVLSVVLPSYPEWAKARGVEAEVVIRFFVSPEGRVLDKMYVERTSGYKELDDLSLEALRGWVFAPVEGGEADQWGFITFRFRLK